ncbi:unnamed protein product [Ambrosiozyma monospora]|uniref:Unnamed protein product n=1 Tax=Ambrosiozyma monospora TaxID=43982 RepID=A0ACB5U7V3_AMBMO|nr:unnamed protein product [Ambrosiozyma monospora]
MNSVERIEEYVEEIPQEPPAVIPETEPSSNWPERGAIEVSNLSIRYAPELPRVIDGVSFNVKPGEKVGIVGRTGAGKSTIIASFFRFVEPDSGYVKIDGVNICSLGLQRLRRALNIIPQDPTLFAGSIRSNLDLFDEFSDAQLYESLKRVSLINQEELDSLTSSSVSAIPVTENVN